MKNNKAEIYQISNKNDHAITGVWHQFRENISGTKVAYVNYKDCIPESPHDYRNAEIWICNIDGTQQKCIREVGKINDHNGANIYWIDDKRIIYHSINDNDRIECYIIDSESGKTLVGPILDAEVRNYNPEVGIAPLIKRPNQFVDYAELLLFEVDTGNISKLFTAKDIANHISVDNRGNMDPRNWEFFLQFINPSGTYISWIVNTGNQDDYNSHLNNKGSEGTKQYLFSCRLDGSDVVNFGLKDYHQYWWDDYSLYGFDEPGQSLQCNIKDRYGKIVKMLFESGNHGSVSPDKRWFVSDLPYNQQQKLLLYKVGQKKPYLELDSFDYKYEYGHRLHIDPSFSRDGKRVYYTKIVDIKSLRSHVFACDISKIIEENR